MTWSMYLDVIEDEMEDAGVDLCDVRSRDRKRVRGYGYARCSGCGNSWASYHSYVIIDLKRQKPVKVSCAL